MVLWVLAKRGHEAGSRFALAVWLVGLSLAVGLLAPRQNVHESPKRFCAVLRRTLPPRARLGILDDDPDADPEWVFYLRRPIVSLGSPTQVHDFLRSRPDHFVLVHRDLAPTWVPPAFPPLATFHDCTAPGETLQLFGAGGGSLQPQR